MTAAPNLGRFPALPDDSQERTYGQLRAQRRLQRQQHRQSRRHVDEEGEALIGGDEEGRVRCKIEGEGEEAVNEVWVCEALHDDESVGGLPLDLGDEELRLDLSDDEIICEVPLDPSDDESIGELSLDLSDDESIGELLLDPSDDELVPVLQPDLDDEPHEPTRSDERVEDVLRAGEGGAALVENRANDGYVGPPEPTGEIDVDFFRVTVRCCCEDFV